MLKEKRFVLPTVTSNMWHPVPEIRERWLRKYGRDRFTFEEALHAQSFPEWWEFPKAKSRKWKWLAEAFPPKVAEHLFSRYVTGSGLTLLDLFAGIGGWSLGAVWSGKFRKLVMIEKDRMKCDYLTRNFSKLGVDFSVICEDVRNIDFSNIDVDVIVSSPPCEDLSMLRMFSKGIIDKYKAKGTVPLTIYTLELVSRIKPKVGFYENVYRRKLRELLKRYGWTVFRFDMSSIIPQKRVRLIGVCFLFV